MEYTLKNNIKNSKTDFLAFNDLAVKVFGLSFEKWYKSGYWRDKYFPYTYFDGEKAVANVSANKIHTIIDGKPKLYIQIGTVMTDPDYRNRGLSRKLMNEVFTDFKNNCDGIYLYGNDTVLDFFDTMNTDRNEPDEMHKLSNLTLLSGTLNTRVGNLVFEGKRQRIVEADATGSEYVPIGTKRVFLKYINHVEPDFDVQQLYFWGKRDQKNYEQEIRHLLAPYIITHNDNN